MEASMTLVYLISFFAVAIAMAFALYLHLWVKKQPCENKTILKVSALIKEGANTFMRKEYKILAAFAGVIAIILFVLLPQPIWKGGDKNAQRMVAEIHRQFNTIKGLREGKADADYGKCIDIATAGALRRFPRTSSVQSFHKKTPTRRSEFQFVEKPIQDSL